MGLLWLLEGFCLRRMTRIHVLSDFSADQLWKLYRIRPERIVKIPGGSIPSGSGRPKTVTRSAKPSGFRTGRLSS